MSLLTNSTLTVDTLDCSNIKLINNTGYGDYALTASAALNHAKSVFKFSYATGDEVSNAANGYPQIAGTSSQERLIINVNDHPGGAIDGDWDNGYTISSSNSGQASPPDGIEFPSGHYPLKFQNNSSNNTLSRTLVFYVGPRGTDDNHYGHAIMFAEASSTRNSGHDGSRYWPCMVYDGMHGSAGKIHTTSDKRLKKNELPIMNAINSINKVNILEYDKLIVVLLLGGIRIAS